MCLTQSIFGHSEIFKILKYSKIYAENNLFYWNLSSEEGFAVQIWKNEPSDLNLRAF